MKESKRVHLRISGRVQGVFYRASARKAALSLGLSGWVKNAADGTVEAAAQGATAAVDQFVDWCRRGSAAASVQEVTVRETPVDDSSSGSFEIRF